MKPRPISASLALLALLSACGGGGGGSSGGSFGGGTAGGTGGGGGGSTAGCSLRERQDWAAAQMREWYLFPETLPASVNAASYSNLSDYVDALTATARGQGRDRYFTYVTSIAEENAYYTSGATAGFGVRLAFDSAAGRLFITEAYEGAPALAAGIDRGAEIVAIGTSASDLRTVSSLVASGGANAVNEALGPSTPGTSRMLRVSDASGTRNVTVAKADYSLTPVSNRYGAKIINDGGKQVGYINLRTFIDTADPALRKAFGQFRSAGITQVVVDLRYNGGGLVSIARLMGNLLGGNRSSSEVFSRTTFRPEKASENSVDYFAPQTDSIAPSRVAFIGTTSSASASELVINSMRPYLLNNAALVGTNTYGKPVGQIALDRTPCDDRLRVIAFSTQNANNGGFYYQGLAPVMEQSCQASDDIAYPLGDPREASVARALDFLAGRSCTRISATADGRTASVRDATGARLTSRPLELLTPEQPSTVQREAPGTF